MVEQSRASGATPAPGPATIGEHAMPHAGLISWPALSTVDTQSFTVPGVAAGDPMLSMHGLFPGMAQSLAQLGTHASAALHMPPLQLAPITATPVTSDMLGDSDYGPQSSEPVVHSTHPPKKRGRPISRNVNDDDKSVSIQEKNRQAQARFRQRQKDKMAVLDKEVAVLKSDTTRLSEENKALLNRKSILEKVLALKEEQIQILQDSVNYHGVKQEGNQEALPASTSHPSMSSAQLIKHWKDCVKALSGLLMKLNADTVDHAAIQQIEALMTETAAVCRKVAFENPMAAKLLVSTRFHIESEPAIPADHWHNVTKALNLREEQKAEWQNLTRTFRANMASVISARRDAILALNEAMPDLYSSRVQAANSLKVNGVVAKVQDMMRQEHRYHFEYMVTVLDKVLDKLQMAQASVTSYPFFPDPLMISTILEEEHSVVAAARQQAMAGAMQAIQ